MNMNILRKSIAISGVLLFLTLTFFPASAGDTSESCLVESSSLLREINHGYPWWSSRTVQIDAATVYLFEDPFFELYSFISNHGGQDVKIRITHVLQKPDGTMNQVSWDQLTLHPGQGVEYWIMCMYLDNQYGRYNYIITVSDTNGNILHQRTVSWVRNPI
ncbi:MAG: hypothetical protein V1726_08640 [Methanobacteriota archaeon]